MIKAIKLIGSREKENKIDEDAWTRWQTKFRHQEIERVKFDIAFGAYEEGEQVYVPEFKGSHPWKHRTLIDYLRDLLP